MPNETRQKPNSRKIFSVAITCLVAAVLCTFAISGTLAKFTSQAQAESGGVPAAQFNFNRTYNPETNSFDEIVWNLQDLGETNVDGYSEKVMYPGAYGKFQLDVSFISDVPATAEANVNISNVSGAFLPEIVVNDDSTGNQDVALRDLISLKFAFVVQDTSAVAPTASSIDWSDASSVVTLSGLQNMLSEKLISTIGDDGHYTELGTSVERTVYVFWKWDYEVNEQGDVYDTLFGNYVARYRQPENGGIESTIGLDVSMTVTQDALDGERTINVKSSSTSKTITFEQKADTQVAMQNGTGYVSDPVGKASASLGDAVVGVLAENEDELEWHDLSSGSYTFENLDSAKKYSFLVRKVSAPAETPKPVTVYTLPQTPSAPVKSESSGNSVTLDYVEGAEYGISSDDGKTFTWQDSNVFVGLAEGQEYTFSVRIKKNGDVPASEPSEICKISTKSDSEIPEELEVWDGTASATAPQTAIGGDGKEYYLIANGKDLAWFKNQVNGGNSAINGKLVKNILLNDISSINEWQTAAPSNSWTPIGTIDGETEDGMPPMFSGVFDGDGHTIAGMYMRCNSESQNSCLGLFGALMGATVKNVGVIDSLIMVDADAEVYYVASVVGYGESTSVINCYNKGSVVVKNMVPAIGGVAGFIANGDSETDCTFANCYNAGKISLSVSGEAFTSQPDCSVGGVWAASRESIILCYGCYNIGEITVDIPVTKDSSGNTESYETSANVGGVFGTLYLEFDNIDNSLFKDCYNSGKVSASNSSVGGLFGDFCFSVESADNPLVLANLYNDGEISATGKEASSVGGLFGTCRIEDISTKIQNCYNTGNISGSAKNAGGLFGDIIVDQQNADITNCYNSGVISNASTNIGGIIGFATVEDSKNYQTGAAENVGSLNISRCKYLASDNLALYGAYLETVTSSDCVAISPVVDSETCGTFTSADKTSLTEFLNAGVASGSNCKSWTYDSSGNKNGGYPYFAD